MGQGNKQEGQGSYRPNRLNFRNRSFWKNMEFFGVKPDEYDTFKHNNHSRITLHNTTLGEIKNRVIPIIEKMNNEDNWNILTKRDDIFLAWYYMYIKTKTYKLDFNTGNTITMEDKYGNREISLTIYLKTPKKNQIKFME